ncbi:uncharacterized protein LOC8289803 [Ricinus communis]|uniref:Uncharacterized protein n=1 Tax=Ricinus communis TaxID=3988 RepID=B9SF83_RICCO|nr:uncharacterized protein LOC8289803 [Ricinus communis]XP_015578161.1 uncharacterized protein LOC8289803 [Ricinus communis]XP_048229704.1 uncharacterized protein LOC8289803 [Ricinus communis]EEF37671.1 conserved hypothetical protein [Ricinus communis]|eukprot:XP_002524652.1 uncharacterized protein LOC8289803 [Ricinus communis]
MEENPPRVSRNKDGTHDAASKGGGGPTTRRKNRYNTSSTVDEGGDLIECSGKYCRSCTAGLIADCVALCCCPCALVNLLALAFVKVPWMVGRKCLGRVKKKRKSSSTRKKRKCKKSCSLEVTEAQGHDQSNTSADDGRDGNLKYRGAEDGILEIVIDGFGEEDDETSHGGGVSARFEAVEKVWLELYQDGHLGFGRVSFTGTQ